MKGCPRLVLASNNPDMMTFPKETFAGDWCTTGDQFHVDEKGYYWYHGRTDDMLKVGGIFVAPAEIENCLLQHEAVLECAVIAHDDGYGLVKPKAFVTLKSGQTPSDALAEELKNFVKDRLAPFSHVPLRLVRIGRRL